MLEVVREPHVHDYFPMPISESTSDFLKMIATGIIVLSFIYRGLHLGDNATIYIKRWSFMYFLKGVIQLVTIIPAADGVAQCSDRGLMKLIQVGNCADMMFSGHTAITFLTCPRKYRFIIVPVMMILLVLTKLHYTGDVIMAVIAAKWIEYEIPLKKKDEEKESEEDQETNRA